VVSAHAVCSSNTSGQSFQPMSGGELMTALAIHTSATVHMTRDTVRFCAYAMGCVMARYLSSAIAHRFSMDAVQHSTSHVSHNLHTTPPNSHTPVTL